MKNRLLVYFILFMSSVMFPLRSQIVDLEKFLQNDDLRGLLCELNGDEVLALEVLSRYRPSDTITINQVWYNVINGLEGISRKYNLKVYKGYSASLRVKAYYWMIKIFRMEYDINDEEVCFFSIWDYDEVKNIPSRKYVKNEEFVVKVDSIDNIVQDWVDMVKIRGLKNVRVSWDPPFRESDYRIYTPLDKLDFYRKCENFRSECE